MSGAKRIVVKIGSALLTDPSDGLARGKIAEFCEQINTLKNSGKEVVLVSSGAIAEGCSRLGWKERPEAIHELQAAAAVGQMGLAQAYESALSAHGRGTAMVMVTHEDLADRQRYLNARATLNELLKVGVVPVINENDTVATDEIRFGDNDTLAALVTNLLQADLLVILTDVNGLMKKDPRIHPDADRVSQAEAEDPSLDGMAGSSVGALGRGGMVTKVGAARLAARSGADSVIASGHEPEVLIRVIAGEDIGTLLKAQMNPLAARKRWIAGQLRAKGDLVIDAGAVTALRDKGVSLLAVGLVAVKGDFNRGDMVRCVTETGEVVAQGLTNYGSADAKNLKGVRSDDFSDHLEYVAEPELMHRDNLVLV